MQPIAVLPRLEKLRQAMAEKELDAVFIVNEANVTYLSGYTNRESFLFLTGSRHGAANVFITDFRYTEQAAAECPDYEIFMYKNGGPSLPGALQLLAQKYGVKRLAFERGHIGYALYEDIRRELTETTLYPSVGLVEELRYVKDEAEAERLRYACEKTDEVFAQVCRYIKPGLTERQVEWRLLEGIREVGCEVSFDCIVVSGPRGSLPHGVANDKVIEAGEFVTMDFGCMYEGYHADMTRTVFVGTPTAEQRAFYALILEANRLGEAAVKAGVAAKDVDGAVRAFMAEQGHDGHFGHGLGHGVGLDIHEEPFLGLAATKTLQANNFITIEPGIYLPGQCGVRIEDTVLVTETGAEVLFSSTKELVCL